MSTVVHRRSRDNRRRLRSLRLLCVAVCAIGYVTYSRISQPKYSAGTGGVDKLRGSAKDGLSAADDTLGHAAGASRHLFSAASCDDTTCQNLRDDGFTSIAWNMCVYWPTMLYAFYGLAIVCDDYFVASLERVRWARLSAALLQCLTMAHVLCATHGTRVLRCLSDFRGVEVVRRRCGGNIHGCWLLCPGTFHVHSGCVHFRYGVWVCCAVQPCCPCASAALVHTYCTVFCTENNVGVGTIVGASVVGQVLRCCAHGCASLLGHRFRCFQHSGHHCLICHRLCARLAD